MQIPITSSDVETFEFFPGIEPDQTYRDRSKSVISMIISWLFLFEMPILFGAASVLLSTKADAQVVSGQTADKYIGGGAPSTGDKRSADDKTNADKEKKPTPEEKMAKRFPQPVRISYLVGLPMLDESNATLGHVQSVVQSHDGKIRLVVDYGGLFGFGSRLIAVPVEVCAMLGRQVAALDMLRAEFDVAPTWYGSGDAAVGREETIQVAIMRR